MRLNRGLMAGLGLAVLGSLAGCSEGSKLPLAEVEKLRRDTEKQMRLVREQNEQINNNMIIIKGELETIKTTYIPAVQASLDSVARIPATTAIQIGNDVDGKISTIKENYLEFKASVNERLESTDKKLTEELSTKLNQFGKDAEEQKALVNFVLAKQDSVNREFAVRIDKRPWYKSILGDWDDIQRRKSANP